MEIKKHYAYFSAAIKDGAKLRPQAAGSRRMQGGGSCAILAGFEAMTGSRDIDCDYYMVKRAYPYLLNRSECPADCYRSEGYRESLVGVIYHLNDQHEWTREAIADWLYAEEEKLGFVTLDETEALKPEMIAEPETVKATAVCSMNLNS